MSYISIDKALESIDLTAKNDGEKFDKDSARYAIQTTETEDVVPVVRCGQCKHWKINPNNLYGGYCRRCECASIDHFCSYGERKNDNE